ncbi:alpha/beta fold hydrolase [Microbacterium sp. STN6]|uniref:alpha/beta fold hydrolase n=1 Tax=Microbacterium sp. STN6 TaxID=2995588 RepID=UPI002260F2B2|nr:alpha/beta fold hydrolase [Microbacterium sp. STN6]MCX7522929.1 alpha/beta fold hydrolase [Microbacterium sp. STN6]
MPHLDVPGASLYFETDGHISRPAILLIAAGIASLRMWDELVPALADDHFIIRYDMRGTGQTQTENVPFSDREDALSLLDHLGVERAVVVGSSRGGRLAIDLALDAPARVSGLVTIGSGPGGFVETELTDAEDAAFDRIDDAYEAKDWHRLVALETELWCVGPVRQRDGLDPAFVERAYELNRPNAVHQAEAPVVVALDPPAFERLGDIRVPALVTVGEYDLSVALAQQAFLADMIPDAAGYIFSDTAHLPSVEHPDEFAQVLTDWLADNGL